ncbi:TerB family tellurite resistance protein [bacterium]|nr:TerB family tellurite resistance protein [bacterium]MBU4310337.1 TerB family tellurite resistance protein [bacterium]MBU4561571.1 TerB family tellurite resistance protein [bacterium]MCG2675909.1 TerB family tellurite resistance protein [bacterium]MCG2677827.1 TerB family tellurite resistance protein [bacterium]
MAGFLDEFRRKVLAPLHKEEEVEPEEVDDKIALGVLLWLVAEADEKFLPEEEKKMEEILTSYAKISEEDMAYVMGAIKEAARERIDLYRFTNEVSKDLDYQMKISILENLFRVACSDKELDDKELETIRKIANLFRLSHRDFIKAKIRVKKEFGLAAAGL